MRLTEAKQILKAKGYRIIKEDEDTDLKPIFNNMVRDYYEKLDDTVYYDGLYPDEDGNCNVFADFNEFVEDFLNYFIDDYSIDMETVKSNLPLLKKVWKEFWDNYLKTAKRIEIGVVPLED